MAKENEKIERTESKETEEKSVQLRFIHFVEHLSQTTHQFYQLAKVDIIEAVKTYPEVVGVIVSVLMLFLATMSLSFGTSIKPKQQDKMTPVKSGVTEILEDGDDERVVEESGVESESLVSDQDTKPKKATPRKTKKSPKKE